MNCSKCGAPVCATEISIKGHKHRRRLGFCKACSTGRSVSELLRIASKALKQRPADSSTGKSYQTRPVPELQNRTPEQRTPGDIVRVAKQRKRRVRPSGWRDGFR